MAVEGDVNVPKFWADLKANIVGEIEAMAEHLSGIIAKNAPVAFGPLSAASNWVPIVEFVETQVFIKVGSPLWFGSGGYGVYVELGSRPHWAPIEPLIRWVEHKIQPHILAIGVEFTGGARATPTRRGTRVLKGDRRARVIQQIARAIQMKIAAKGTAGQYFVLKSIQEMGLRAQLNDDGVEPYYEIDVADWLNRQLPSIIQRSIS